MKDILKQEWEDISNDDLPIEIGVYENGQYVSKEVNSAHILEHLLTTHNFCKDIPDGVMRNPLLNMIDNLIINSEKELEEKGCNSDEYLSDIGKIDGYKEIKQLLTAK